MSNQTHPTNNIITIIHLFSLLYFLIINISLNIAQDHLLHLEVSNWSGSEYRPNSSFWQ